MIPWESTSLHLSMQGSERRLQLHAHGVHLASALLRQDGQVGIELALHAPGWAEDLAREAMEEWTRQDCHGPDNE